MCWKELTCKGGSSLELGACVLLSKDWHRHFFQCPAAAAQRYARHAPMNLSLLDMRQQARGISCLSALDKYRVRSLGFHCQTVIEHDIENVLYSKQILCVYIHTQFKTKIDNYTGSRDNVSENSS